jgi:hypothetical protein
MKKVILLIILLLISTTAFSMTISEAEKYMDEAAIRWNVKKSYVKAVAEIESRKGGQKYRFGKMGKTYYGPMGIHKDFLKKWAIDDPVTNINVGARALRDCQDEASLKKRLRRYNASFNGGYWSAVIGASRKYAMETKK